MDAWRDKGNDQNNRRDDSRYLLGKWCPVERKLYLPEKWPRTHKSVGGIEIGHKAKHLQEANI